MDAVDGNNKPIPFSITFYTADMERGTGGERIKIETPVATKYRQVQHHASPASALETSQKSKSPHHGVHFTRNILYPGKEHPVKVHGRLITRFNGKRVIW